MICKGIIEDVIDSRTAKVRVPILNGLRGASGSTGFDDLYEANVIATPWTTGVLNYGDIVCVGFINDDYREPVILGKFVDSAQFEGYTIPNTGIVSKTKPSQTLSKLKVEDSVELPSNIKVGGVQLFNLITKLCNILNIDLGE